MEHHFAHFFIPFFSDPRSRQDKENQFAELQIDAYDCQVEKQDNF